MRRTLLDAEHCNYNFSNNKFLIYLIGYSFGLNHKILPAIKPFKAIWIEQIKDDLLKILFGAGIF